MRTARALMAMATLAAITVLSSSAAMAVTFTVDVSVGWIDSTGTCQPVNTACLGFSGVGGFGAGSSLVLNWDNQTDAPNSFLRVGALPDVAGFPVGTGSTTIDPGQTVRTIQIQFENNGIPPEDDFLGSILLRTLLEITGPGGEPIIGAGTGGDLDVSVTSLDGNQFTFIQLEADIPFAFEGANYILQVRGLLNENGTPACENTGGGNVSCLTPASEISDRFVAITLLQEPFGVPAPASLLLVALGLVGVGALPLVRMGRPRLQGIVSNQE